jgi:predicted RecB family nuclease
MKGVFMSTYITASMLYSHIQCAHRVWRDVHGPQEEKSSESNAFVQLLWDRGVQHEEAIIKSMGNFIDLSTGSIEERFKRTLEEMKKGASLIFQGVIIYNGLLGIPDLLRNENGTYVPIDIKSGKGLEGVDEGEDEEGKPKKHYAVQIGLYIDVLKGLGFARDHRGLVIDIEGREIEYLLDRPQGIKTPQTLWDVYQEVKAEVQSLVANQSQNNPALAGVCKLCPWYVSCKKWCKETDDLTNIFYLGRAKRDTMNMDLGIDVVKDLYKVDVASILSRKKSDKGFLKGVGEGYLNQFVKRAKIMAEKLPPVLYEPVALPKVSKELYFDIEDDPTQGVVYLHGIYEMPSGRFIYFMADDNSLEAERRAWAGFWEYIRNLTAGDYAVYYYSHHEKTTFKKLQTKHPGVISQEEVVTFFENSNVIDLYKIALQKTDWPLSSYGIKEIATYLGFKWRDQTPSGALSIQWYNEYLQTKDKVLLKRILEYNEDDCRAMEYLVKWIKNYKASAIR